ncbi:GNAT family N-acetyltransferase [Frankia sp. CNm7]|uniref:GNAT family N-acetyltransferase n=1 Tax=Frankia nepalensis TaxID=1836974 RepID=A0A937UPY3_9ACTN|nr:GNAT family N-acetyltransferase [Frankia nepalensis]MBL7501345.1 GNAT family N-acetyltransferase [Frankia nepalensis]MBL7509868.1 GNAT family N-acetyltransferase [Frankia nepalensis]MBL7520693.1 GNAT family N-acetyltransferase [Frankia nepalensis]MBL7629627.1 GNAT family N-acetyltransferase [Frankia nepalensis]
MGDDGPTLTTTRLQALPVTLWNAAYVAEELAQKVALAPRPAPGLGVGGLFAGPDARGTAEPAALRHELRHRAGAGRAMLTWVVRDHDAAAVGLLGADTRARRAAVAVVIGPAERRRGYAAEIIRALASWLEANRFALVETRVRAGSPAAERLAATTSFVPTRVVITVGWRVWCRPPTR